MKTCFLSIDVEKREDDGSFEGVEKLDNILDIFRKYKANATLFVTGEVLKNYPELVKKWADDYEIGSHGYYHNTLDKLDFEARSKQLGDFGEIYRSIFKTPPRGFRAPRNIIDNEQFPILEKHGFIYDASVFPRYPWRIHRYEGYIGKAPTSPYFPDTKDHKQKGNMKIFEIPEAGLAFAVPLVGTWIRKLGIGFYKILFLLKRPKFINFNMHSWDGAEFEGGKNSGKTYLKQLDKMLGYLKKIGYEFKSGEKIYGEFCKNR